MNDFMYTVPRKVHVLFFCDYMVKCLQILIIVSDTSQRTSVTRSPIALYLHDHADTRLDGYELTNHDAAL